MANQYLVLFLLMKQQSGYNVGSQVLFVAQ